MQTHKSNFSYITKKLSGQRWTIKGAQEIVNLRAYKKSNLWNVLVDFIKNAA